MPSSAKAKKSRVLSSRGEVKHILLVEDDHDLAVLLKDYLEAYFYRVNSVANGVAGLKAILDSDFLRAP